MMDEERSLPRQIGPYRIIDFLGEGGMSIVYTAMQEHPRRKVALKVLRGGLFSPTAAKRFHQEVEILGKLDHPWIAKIYDAGTHDDGNGATPYFVMEHVENARELSRYIDEESLDQREVLKLFTMISSAVEHGHHRGIVHRDLKPGNILIDSNNEPKIIDFGVARSIDRGTVNEQVMTEAGRLVGTVQFMAPEQVDTTITDIDARCDVYALGVVLYQMLTKRLPRTLEGLPIYEAVRQICEEDPVRPTVYDDSIDQDLEAIIMKALQTDRQKRYQTAGAFGRDMLRYLGNRPIKARKVTAIDRARLFGRRHKKHIVVWGSIILLVGAVIWAAKSWQDSTDDQMEALQHQVSELSKERDILENATSAIPTDDAPVTSDHTLPSVPRDVAVSLDGSTLVATLEDEFHASTIEGNVIALPPINIEPAEAIIEVSQDGSLFAIVSEYRCRIVLLGQQEPPLRISVALRDVTALAVSNAGLAIALEDMSLQLLSSNNSNNGNNSNNKTKRALSTSGVFKVVAFDRSGIQMAAATDHQVYLWNTNTFPKQRRIVQSVNDPCLIGFVGQDVVVVGRDGQVAQFSLDHYPTFEMKGMQSLELNGTITYAALSTGGTFLGCIVNEKAYRCDLVSGEIIEATWMPEIPVGVAVTPVGGMVLWTADGAVFLHD